MTTSSEHISVVVVTPSYDGADRCRFLLETWEENDPLYRFAYPHVICADYTGKDRTRPEYDALAADYANVEVVYRDTVGCCDGASRTAIEHALAKYDPEWVLLLSDDLAVTPGSLSNVFYFIRCNDLNTIGAFQPPYWNCTDEDHELEYYFPGVRRQQFYASKEWTRDVPRCSHWEVPGGFAHPFFTVHGNSFAVKSETYREVGGIADGSWRYDETLSYRIWTRSDKAIVALPGPPLIHYMGGGFAQGPAVDWQMGNEEHWIQATGVGLQESIRIRLEKMNERASAVNEEMERCRYWDRSELCV